MNRYFQLFCENRSTHDPANFKSSGSRSLRKFHWLYISLFSLFSIAKSQTGINLENFKGVDSTFTAFMGNWNIKGGSVAITKDGHLVYNRAFGFTNNAGTKIAKPHDLFRIASVSKPITSVAIMKLIEEGKLSMDQTIFGPGKILGNDYYSSIITDERIFAITIRNLLEHTAGWERKEPYENYESCDPPFFPLRITELEEEPNPVGDSTIIRFSLKKGLTYSPGTKYSYSNVGYLILGKVIEKVTGMTYENYLQNKIFSPLSICDIHLGKNLLEDKQERETEYINSLATLSCYGNGFTVPWQYGGFNLEAMNAHGGWISSASDFTKLVLAVDGFNTVPDILSRETTELMSAPGEVNRFYAKGWGVNARDNWWHTGSLDGTASFVCRTSGGYTWAILFNSRSDNSTAFWKALDRLPWNALKTVKQLPAIDLFPPKKNVTEISATILSPGTVKLNWNNGDGDGRLVLVSEDATLTEFPEDGISYFGEPSFGEGSKLGEKAYVVYNGIGSGTTLTDLDPRKTYYVTAFEYFINPKSGYYEVYKLGCRDEKMVVPDVILKPSVM